MKSANSNTVVTILVLLSMLLAACAPAAEPAPIEFEPAAEAESNPALGVELQVPSDIIGGPMVAIVVLENTTNEEDFFELTATNGEDGDMKAVCQKGKLTLYVLKGGEWIKVTHAEIGNCRPETILRHLENRTTTIAQKLVELGFTGEEVTNLIRLVKWFIENKK